jgi:hypothetical protein
MENKTIIGLTGIIAMTALQMTAWLCGHNGTVFAFTSGVTGAIIGYFFGWERNVKATVKEFIEAK